MSVSIDEAVSFKNIVVGTDFEECSQRAISVAANLAKAAGGQLILVHTFELPAYGYAGIEISTVDWLTPMQQAAQQSLNELVEELKKRGINARGILGIGVAWEHLLQVAKEVHADTIVVGTHGRRGVVHALLGSVAEKIVRMSPIPVLTVRGPK